MGFPSGPGVQNLPTNAGDMGSIPGAGRSPGEGHGNPLLYSCLENLIDRRVWRATVDGVAKVRHDLETTTITSELLLLLFLLVM